MPLSTQTHMTLLSLQGVTEFQLKSVKCERSIVGWEVRSVGVKCLAHGSSKPHLLLTDLSLEWGKRSGEGLVMADAPSVWGLTAALESRELLN